MAMPAGSRADSARRDTPETFIRYWCANPFHFRSTFGKPLSEENLKDQLRRQFPGRLLEHPMGLVVTAPAQGKGGVVMSKIGMCVNCLRGKMTIVRKDLCGTCDKAAGSLGGKARETALEEIRGKIERGEVKPRGINTKRAAAIVDISTANAGMFSGEAKKALSDSVQKIVRGRAEGKDHVEAKLRGLLRLIDETSKMGLATDITVSIRIGGVEP